MDEDEKRESKKPGAYLRSQKVLAPLPPSFSPLLIKKMEIVLEELGINDDQIVCTETV